MFVPEYTDMTEKFGYKGRIEGAAQAYHRECLAHIAEFGYRARTAEVFQYSDKAYTHRAHGID